MLKKALILLYMVVVAVMAAATFIEHADGYRIYDQWWFTALWALLTAVAVGWFLQQRVRRPMTIALHLSFVIILLGALLTRLTSHQGMIHLRWGEQTSRFTDSDGRMQPLPFTLRLDSFKVQYHEGTSAAADYVSHLTLSDDDDTLHAAVSMNNICRHRDIRLYQGSYDSDCRGSVLMMNSDPWGIPVTYTGYALLFVSLIWMLLDPRGQFRQLLRSPLLQKGALILLLFCSATTDALAAPRSLSKEEADQFGHRLMLYNNRICPVETYALDFVTKLYGKRHYGDYTACQVLTGFLYYGDEWCQEPIVRIKNGELKEARQLPDYASVNLFFHPHTGYMLGPFIEEYYQGGQHDAFHQQAVKIDDQLMMVMDVRQNFSAKLLPADAANDKEWSTRLPSPHALQAEHIYNALPFTTILFIFDLTMGLLSLFSIHRSSFFIFHFSFFIFHLSSFIFHLSFFTLTFVEALRWIISGNIPMSNGYETMLLMAWLVQFITLLLSHRLPILLSFGFLLSGFFLLVSHLSQMDPQIGRLMPVLNSPLLTIHVGIIMMAYALLSLTFLSSLIGLISYLRSPSPSEKNLGWVSFSSLFLYPALTTLGIGIFTGAIWANVSWGNYWSWDPKETWALITFMVYAIPVHKSLRFSHFAFHLYIVLAFLTILMTYFGVNYFLGGMHSYA